MELGKNATDELCNSSKWPFWQASMKIHLILVYWDARNSLPYNLVMPYKDGVTFAVTTATQSLQRCGLESVADMTYVAITKSNFGANFQNFELKMHIAVVQRLQWDPKDPKDSFRTPKNYLNLTVWNREPNKVYTLLCCSD